MTYSTFRVLRGPAIPQFRVVKDFDKTEWVGLSVESPQALITAGSLGSGAAAGYTFAALGGKGNFADTTSASDSNLNNAVSLDQYPDIVGKVAVDPGFRPL